MPTLPLSSPPSLTVVDASAGAGDGSGPGLGAVSEEDKVFSEATVEEAWAILTHMDKVAASTSLTELLSDLGVCDSKDLAFCQPLELQALANTLKKVPRRRFCQLLNVQLNEATLGLNTAALGVCASNCL